jgi:hypothetical protein
MMRPPAAKPSPGSPVLARGAQLQPVVEPLGDLALAPRSRGR